jgi:hypothetical protein
MGITVRKTRIYVDRIRQQWIVEDQEGNFWMLPNADDPWNERQPFLITAESELEPVPSHYKYLLRLPDQA